ncbi:TPA: hypothetical protein N0F65_012071, partial [Lagenidium giganteum]
MLALDLQGLIYKLRVLGPHEKTYFKTEVFGIVRDEPLQPIDPLFNTSLPKDDLDSSWPHWLAACEQLRASDAGDKFFLIAAGENCTIGHGGARRKEPHVVLASSVRVDSIVWTSCRLLFQARQPSICHDPIVTDYLDRYMLDAAPIALSQLAVPGSDAEQELVAFLDMVSNSYPHHKMVCVEGFALRDPAVGTYTASFLGCASPNLYQNAVVGLSNPSFIEFHRRRVWLTADVFEVFGLQFRIRQNNMNHYEIGRTAEGKLTTSSLVQPNFSCFGSLYVIMIALDIILIIAFIRASWEVVRFVLIPQTLELQRRLKSEASLISWLVVMPNSVVWVWGDSTATKIQAYLCSLRVWVLTLIACNVIWAIVVRVSERGAYFITSRTYITTMEIIVIGGIVAAFQRLDVFNMCERKWQLENQR